MSEALPRQDECISGPALTGPCGGKIKQNGIQDSILALLLAHCETLRSQCILPVLPLLCLQNIGAPRVAHEVGKEGTQGVEDPGPGFVAAGHTWLGPSRPGFLHAWGGPGGGGYGAASGAGVPDRAQPLGDLGEGSLTFQARRCFKRRQQKVRGGGS